jgi:hypothetical protein
MKPALQARLEESKSKFLCHGLRYLCVPSIIGTDRGVYIASVLTTDIGVYVSVL